MSSAQDGEGSDTSGSSGQQSIGKRLSAARQQRKLSIEAVADELKLDTRMVEALERDDRSVLPAPIFVQGYLRRYARLVGLPEDQLVRDYADSSGEPPPLTVVAIKQKRAAVRLPSGRLIRNTIILLLAAIMLWLAYPYVERFITARMQGSEQQEPGRLDLPPANQLQLPQEAPR